MLFICCTTVVHVIHIGYECISCNVNVRSLQNTKQIFVFDHSLGTVTLTIISITSYNAKLSLVQYSLSPKLGVQSNFAEYLEIEKTHDVEGSLLVCHASGGGHF